MFGGTSTAARNKRVAELLDMGFARAPSRVAVVAPVKPAPGATVFAVAKSPQAKRQSAQGRADRRRGGQPASTPPCRRRWADEMQVPVETEIVPQASAEAVAEADEAVSDAVAAALEAEASPPATRGRGLRPHADRSDRRRPGFLRTVPRARPGADSAALADEAAPEVVSRLSTSGGRHWGINVGRYSSRYQAERVLLQTALAEIGTLDEALRKVVQRPTGFEANFVGLTARGGPRLPPPGGPQRRVQHLRAGLNPPFELVKPIPPAPADAAPEAVAAAVLSGFPARGPVCRPSSGLSNGFDTARDAAKAVPSAAGRPSSEPARRTPPNGSGDGTLFSTRSKAAAISARV